MPTLNWIGKDKVINHHQDVPYKVLEQQYTYSNGSETDAFESENKIIHGDNLEALKSLLPQYEGKIKCIYIDPPYNTGNESWVYNDNVNHPNIKRWLGEVVGNETDDLSRHDKWLCMMYPRLQLLNKLLSDDGIIFISIDDNEQSNLKIICDNIFGKSNFLTQLIWNSEGNTDNQLEVKINHEYILLYTKNSEKKNASIGRVIDPNTREDSNLWKGIADNNINKNSPANPPDLIELPIGFPCIEEELFYKCGVFDETFFQITKNEGYISDEIKLRYSIENKSGLPVKLDDMIVKNFKLTQPCRIYGGYANGNKLKAFINNGCKPIIDGDNPISFYLNKNAAVRYRKVVDNPRNILSVLRNFGTTEKMKTELKKMGFNFSYPKPVELIKYLISIGANDKNSIILDSFAGSGTTGHAVLQLNNEDEGKRKFILIQMDEYDKEGNIVNICRDITSKRIEKVITGYNFKKEKFRPLFGDFSYYELGETIFLENDLLNEAIGIERINEYVWFSETKSNYIKQDEQYLLGVKEQTAYYFYYDSNAMTTLDESFLRKLKTKVEQYIIYADNCLLDEKLMSKYHIIFKKIPRDITRF